MAESPGGTGDGDRDELADELARAEAELAELDRRREAVRARVESVRERIGTGSASEDAQAGEATNRAVAFTPDEKIDLFRTLFRGRPDVFPTRFVSRRTGRPGYAPACSNKFVRGICDLPKTKCGDCPNQAFRKGRAVGLLFHLEVSAWDVPRWIDAYADELNQVDKTRVAILYECQSLDLRMQVLTEKLLENFLALA